MVYKMRLKGYLTETTQPTVKMTIDALKIAFRKILQIMGQVDLFDIDDKTALTLLRKGFDDISIKLEIVKSKGGVRKYLAGGEFGGDYGKDYAWLIKLLPGFSKVFKKFAKEKGKREFMDHNKNPLFREFVELVSHEILHSQQALNSAGAAFDPELQGISSTYTGNMKEYLKNPLEIEPYAQQAAIDVIRKGGSIYIQTMRELFPIKSKVWKKFVKKYKFYIEILKKEGDIKPYKK